jgi:hypothetical protein
VATPTPPASTARSGRKRTREEPQRQQQQPSEQQPEGSGSESEVVAPRLPSVKTILKGSSQFVWKYRFHDRDLWFPEQRQTPDDHPFWTELQQRFHRAYHHTRTQVQPHRRLVMNTMARAVPMAVESFQQYFNYMLGMLDLFTLPGHYILDWVEIFYSTVFIQSDRSRIMFMFEGESHVLHRSDIAAALRLQESDLRLHDLVYPDIPPSRRPVCLLFLHVSLNNLQR